MGEAAAVYTEKLTKLKYGHPLWWPEPIKGPGGKLQDVEIGDVGYVDDGGAFISLFNVTYDASHERNVRGTPSNFTPLDFDRSFVDIKERFCTRGPLYSTSVKSYEVKAHLTADPMPVDAALRLSYQFRCLSSQGAFLMLWDDATRFIVRQDLKFKKYMRENHDSWVEFVTQRLEIGLSPEDIVLVRGTIKTSCWTVGAFVGCETHEHGVTLDGQLGPMVNVGFTYLDSEKSQTSPVISRSGPLSCIVSNCDLTKPKPLPVTTSDAPDDRQCHTHVNDQCVFVNYYKMKKRPFLPSRIVAAANSSSTDDSEPGGESSAMLVDVVTEATQSTAVSCDPLDTVLDYMLDVSGADSAIASHSDLEPFVLDDRETPLTTQLLVLAPKVYIILAGTDHSNNQPLPSVVVLSDTYYGDATEDVPKERIALPSPNINLGVGYFEDPMTSQLVLQDHTPSMSFQLNISQQPPQLHIVPYVPYQLHGPQFGMAYQRPIFFTVNGQPGAPLRPTAPWGYDNINDSRALIFEGCGTKITYVVQIAGYRPFKQQKYALTRSHGINLPCNRARVLRQVAEVMETFMQIAEQEVCDGPLQFGQEGIQLEDLFLVELRRVSKSCFQPILAIEGTRVPRALMGELLESSPSSTQVDKFSDSLSQGTLDSEEDVSKDEWLPADATEDVPEKQIVLPSPNINLGVGYFEDPMTSQSVSQHHTLSTNFQPTLLYIVPYVPYQSHRRQFEIIKQMPTLFTVNGQPGAPLRPTAPQGYDDINDSQACIFEGCGTKITYVVQITGYRPFKQQKYALTRSHGINLPCNRARVLRQVAKVMEAFIQSAEQEVCDGSLQFGQGGIQLEDLFLVELRRVSKSHFQPILAIEGTRVPRALIGELLESSPSSTQVDKFSDSLSQENLDLKEDLSKDEWLAADAGDWDI